VEVLKGGLLEEEVIESDFKGFEEVALVERVGLAFLERSLGLVLAVRVRILLHFIQGQCTL
jgi:hypothetical protein